MLGFLKPKLAPEGPFEFDGDVVIERPAEEVYALLDWTDPRNAQRQLGNEIVAVEGAPHRFQMTLTGLPGHVFHMTVTKAVPHASYNFTTEIMPMLGRVVTSHEQYSLEPRGAGACRLILVNLVTFVDRMRMKQLGDEAVMMTVTCHNALAKLKIHAEQGTDAVKAQDGRLIV